MHKDDIKLAEELIEKNKKQTPYGPALSMTWSLLESAIKEIKRQNNDIAYCNMQ